MIGKKNVKHFKFQYLITTCWKEFYLNKFKLETGNNMAYQQIHYQLTMVFLFSTVEDGL